MIELLSSAQEFIGENGFKGIRISTRPDAVDGEICDILENITLRRSNSAHRARMIKCSR